MQFMFSILAKRKNVSSLHLNMSPADKVKINGMLSSLFPIIKAVGEDDFPLIFAWKPWLVLLEDIVVLVSYIILLNNIHVIC